ncbi:MAG: 23S rRNA (pseudouridine(1915)-N(3))-methyltransferase RlmH [Candidatus Peribacteraceae bacterium]|nr:23S rRNA (pseudouridine(1915)-N(3))-methyltransferase RlmH [Candidatus Peribacteraceae bacterium]
MQHITLLTVGRVKSSWINEGCQEYLDRLRPSVKFTITEIPPSRQKDTEKQRQEESEQILHALEKQRGDIFLLDEAGERMASKQFSVFLSKAEDMGIPLTFIIGGAYGVSDHVRSIVRGSIRLSDMTLTHEMSRLFFLEQLYRAMEIKKGGGYHH